MLPAARSFPALYADPRDRQLLGLASPAYDKERVLYVLTLGVAEASQRVRRGKEPAREVSLSFPVCAPSECDNGVYGGGLA